jgi:hypothetical protein
MKKNILFLVILFIAIPFFADACPLCQGGQGYTKETIIAYKWVTAFLALLPMLMAFGIFRWIFKNRKNLDKTSQ